jgi:hypothetical protein
VSEIDDTWDDTWPTAVWPTDTDDDDDWPTLDELRESRRRRTKYLRSIGATAWLCGVSDGRGKVCGRILDQGTFDITDGNNVVMECPKHRQVFCEGREFVAASKGHRSVLYFRSFPNP